MAETLDSEVLVIANTKQYRVQLKLLLAQSPYLEGICYPPIARINFQQYPDGVIKHVIEFCKHGKLGFTEDHEKDQLLKFAKQTKMDKLKEYLDRLCDESDFFYPRIQAQGGWDIPLKTKTISESSIEDDEEEEEEIQRFQVCCINTLWIEPAAEEREETRPQSYIPQDPLHSPPIITAPSRLPAYFPPIPSSSTFSHRTLSHRRISRAPSSADEAEEGILGPKEYELVSYVPDDTLTFQPIPAAAPAAQSPTFFERIIYSFFSKK